MLNYPLKPCDSGLFTKEYTKLQFASSYPFLRGVYYHSNSLQKLTWLSTRCQHEIRLLLWRWLTFWRLMMIFIDRPTFLLKSCLKQFMRRIQYEHLFNHPFLLTHTNYELIEKTINVLVVQLTIHSSFPNPRPITFSPSTFIHP